MSSSEPLINTVANNQYTETNTSSNDITQTKSNSSKSPHHSRRSAWGYVKYIFWTAVTGIFNCGHTVLEQPVTDPWPVGSEDERLSVDECAVPAEVHWVSELSSVDGISLESVVPITEEVVPIDSQGIIELEPLQKYVAATVLEASIVQHSTTIISDPFDERSLREFDLPFNIDTDPTLLNGLYVGSSLSYSPALTLIGAYYAEANKGLIDELTRDTLIDELVKSVIPRNLSNSSGVSVSPKTRKMYAWTDPPTEPIEVDPNTRKNKHFEMDSNSSASDERLPYPGKLSMSDSSSSPLSPATTESKTLLDNCDQDLTNNKYDAIQLPGLDRQDHTLAWAMANLRTDDQPDNRIISDRPPVPNSLTRRSRDKSPVSTANSAHLVDTQSVPANMEYDGYHLFDDEAYAIPKPKRSSSLKSQRTPPGTPGQKVVRFADALGLDLETVRHVFDHEAPPKIPASATFDLELDTDESIAKLGAKQFRMCFAQPGSAANFIRRVLDQTVCLEDAHVEMPRGVLNGTIRVKSLGFEKRVFVRATYNDWSTYCDTPASYVQGSHDGATDRFSFSLVFPDTMVPGRRVQFAVRYDAHTGEQFWDNNYGQNYSVVCYAKATDLAGDGSWVHYL